MITSKQYQKFSFIALFAVIIVLAFLIVKPFIIAIITAFVVGYIFYPVYRLIKKLIKNSTLSSLLTSLIIVLIIIIPMIFLINAISNEAYTMFTVSKQKVISGEIVPSGYCEGESGLFCTVYNGFASYTSDLRVKYYISQSLEKISSYLVESSTSFIFSIPLRILEFFLTFFVLFYFFKDHDKIVGHIKKILPIKKSLKIDLMNKIENVTYAIVFGYILVALFEGLVGALGFYLFVGPNSSFVLWGLIIAFLALIPLIGAPLVLIPAAIIQFVSLNPLGGFGLLLCLLITSYADNITRPKIIGKKSDIHPGLIIIGVLGGLAFMGFIGIFVGPIVLASLNTLINVLGSKKYEAKS